MDHNGNSTLFFKFLLSHAGASMSEKEPRLLHLGYSQPPGLAGRMHSAQLSFKELLGGLIEMIHHVLLVYLIPDA